MILIPLAVMVCGIALVGYAQIENAKLKDDSDEKRIRTLVFCKRGGLILGLIAILLASYLQV